MLTMRLPHIFLERNAWISCENVTNISNGSGTKGEEKCRGKAGLENVIIPIPLHTTDGTCCLIFVVHPNYHSRSDENSMGVRIRSTSPN